MWNLGLRSRARRISEIRPAPPRTVGTPGWTITLGVWPPEDLRPDAELLLVLQLPPGALATCRRGLAPDPRAASVWTELGVLIELGMMRADPDHDDRGTPRAERLQALVADGLVTLYLAGTPWVRRPAAPAEPSAWLRRETCLLGVFVRQKQGDGRADNPIAAFEDAYWAGRGVMAEVRLGSP